MGYFWEKGNSIGRQLRNIARNPVRTYILDTHKVHNQRIMAGETNLISPQVLVSCGCWNRLPQFGWLKATEMYPLAILEVRGLKSRCQRGCAPSRGCREIHSLPFPASAGCWHSLLMGLTPISASVSTWPSPPCLLCPPGNPEWSHLAIISLIISAQIPFPGKSTFTVSRMWTYIFGSHHSNHYTSYDAKLRFKRFLGCVLLRCREKIL